MLRSITAHHLLRDRNHLHIRHDAFRAKESGLDSTPPDGGYGWLCVAACFMINFATWGAVAVSSPLLTAKCAHDLTTLAVLWCLFVLLPR